MPLYTVFLELRVRAEDIPEARAVGEIAFKHLYATCNDQESIQTEGRVTVVPPTTKGKKL